MQHNISYKLKLNSVTERLPKHLHKFIVKQPYSEYTPQNQAVWRYVMRLNTDYLSQVAHDYYLKGIEKTGISIESIPEMEGMNRILKDIGWAAVSVDGFIPPNAFMEFQAYNVLVIASDMRTIDHITYTPAPDIIHEAAGHAPIIANPEYAEYLRRFGEIGSKAISSSKDYELYEAVRLVSILKENPNSKTEDIDTALNHLNHVKNNMGELSEMAQIRNLHWWTVEYGLIGDIENPKIYGAGLLSSIGESKECLNKTISKLPYSIDAAKVDFDITKAQPQLFVTPTFAHLSFVLEKFANTMALRKGGLYGVNKLIESKNIGTIELSTGIQISGVFTNVITHDDKAIYIQTTGESALASSGRELIGHGIKYHTEGFGSPIGKLEGINLAIEDMSPKDLETYGIIEGFSARLLFEGGILVEGKIITGKRDLRGKVILISFENCKVTYKKQILFEKEWGIFDMAIGKEITSAYAGPASPDSFDDLFKVSEAKTHKINYTDSQLELHLLYKMVRDFREEKIYRLEILTEIFNNLKSKYPNDWLLPLEIYELIHSKESQLKEIVFQYLVKLKSNKDFEKLIADGLRLISKEAVIIK
ncbi:aromatic amino acid hydroxylase [Hyunsoonleella sp. 2307UL5-6]|uniref:aromatic amino acid hydroxylase n=1 Tax=Hyunsoonleella sp. 2307UL5-6 TaxID=3384768 RepID=UPI0039BC7999